MTRSELCQTCGNCCKYFILDIFPPRDEVRWKEWATPHSIEVVTKYEYVWRVKVNVPCGRLVEEDGIYSCRDCEPKPQACVDFDGTKADPALKLECKWNEVPAL